jgi:O-antigen ligase
MTFASWLGLMTLLGGVPACMALLLFLPRLQPVMLGVMAFATCHIKKPFYQEIGYVAYRGTDRGFGVTVPDLIFLGFALYLASGAARRRLVWWPYNTSLWVMLLAVLAASCLASPLPLYGAFTFFKFVRAFILFWVIVNVVTTRADVLAVCWGLFAAVLLQGTIVLWARYVTGAVVNRALGSFPHPNTLSMYVSLIMPVALALALCREIRGRLLWGALAVVAVGAICVLFTKSRAGLAVMLAGLGSVAAVTSVTHPNGRVLTVFSAGGVLALILGIVAGPTVVRRFQTAPKESEMTRVYFNAAAKHMAADHTFGVGLNLFSWAVENTDYYWDVYQDHADDLNRDEFRESKEGASRLGTAHHIYYLFAGETGWGGMVIFILFILRFSWRTLSAWFRQRDPVLQACLLGLLAGTACVHVQGLLEWALRQTQLLYLYTLACGLAVAIARVPPPAAVGRAPRATAVHCPEPQS